MKNTLIMAAAASILLAVGCPASASMDNDILPGEISLASHLTAGAAANPAYPSEIILASHLTAGAAANPAYPSDIVERAAQFPGRDLSQSPLYGSLEKWEKAALKKLIQAAAYMDNAFWQQADPQGRALWRRLAKSHQPEDQAVRTLLDANYGRWDRFLNFAPFVGEPIRPAGGYVYPADLGKAELEAYVAAHPEQKADLLSPYTVVKRRGARLVAVPYHREYAAFVKPAAKLLRQAARLSRNASLARYLELEARALLTDDYYEANLAWLDLDANLDISIGPHETYDDQMIGQKAYYKANVLIVDRAAAGKLDRFKSTGPALQDNLPVDAKYKPAYKAGTMMPLLLADDVRRAGQAKAIMEPVAFSLPNDPKVWAAKGSKKVMMGNYLDARRTVVLEPLARAILAPEVSGMIQDEAYFTWVLMHEVCHTLGPREVVKDGQTLTPRAALGQYYSPIEEGKADIGGLYNIPYLIEHGITTLPLEWHYAGFMAESLRSIRFGMGSAYGIIRSAAWNVFVDEGALVYDAASNRFTMNVPKMTVAVSKLLVTLLTLEGEGDHEAAAGFIQRYANVRPELQKLLDSAEQSVPLEFIPVYGK